MEKKKQTLLDQYKHKKMGSDSSPGSSKKSSVDLAEGLLSPPLQKRVVRLQEYEEAAIPAKIEVNSASPKPEELTRSTHSPSHDKISEMERRVKEELEVELTARGREEQSKSSSSMVGINNSPRHSTPDLPRQSPVLSDKWVHHTSPSSSSSSSSDTRLPHTSTAFGHFPPPSPTLSHSKKAGHKLPPHSDSNEWTEFACASVSGSSVEVGSGPFSVYSTHPSSGETISSNMSEFDPIKTESSSADPSKPSMTN